MKLALTYSTKDRVELTKQTIPVLLDGARKQQFDLFWVDGSTTKAGEQLSYDLGYPTTTLHHNVRGGADAAIVYALTLMLEHPENYTHVGLVENDVLLHPGWFVPTIALFERAKLEGFEAGAVSARCYEDRILCQRNGYAVCHNLGAGMVIFTREAAQIVLDNFRTGWWPDNRAIFAQLSSLDIGRWAAFRTNTQMTTADWHFDAVLASNGLASLALTPSPVEMVGQVPPLAEQGLTLATEPVELLRDDKAFQAFVLATTAIRDRIYALDLPNTELLRDADRLIFPHQIPGFGGYYSGDWRLKWSQGFGPFAWVAGWDGKSNLGQKFSENQSMLTVPVYGPCAFLVSGGKDGGRVLVEDLVSGYRIEPDLAPEGPETQTLQLVVPAGVLYRDVQLTALTPGVTFYGLSTTEPQPWRPAVRFTHAMLPPV